MKRITIVVAVLFAVTATGLAFSGDGGRHFREFLTGVKEAAAPIATTGSGTFEATISTVGDVAISVIDVKSFSASYGRFV